MTRAGPHGSALFIYSLMTRLPQRSKPPMSRRIASRRSTRKILGKSLPPSIGEEGEDLRNDSRKEEWLSVHQDHLRTAGPRLRGSVPSTEPRALVSGQVLFLGDRASSAPGVPVASGFPVAIAPPTVVGDFRAITFDDPKHAVYGRLRHFDRHGLVPACSVGEGQFHLLGFRLHQPLMQGPNFVQRL